MTFLLYLVVPASEAFVLKTRTGTFQGPKPSSSIRDHVVLGRHEPLHVLARDRMVEAEAGGSAWRWKLELVLDL